MNNLPKGINFLALGMIAVLIISAFTQTVHAQLFSPMSDNDASTFVMEDTMSTSINEDTISQSTITAQSIQTNNNCNNDPSLGRLNIVKRVEDPHNLASAEEERLMQFRIIVIKNSPENDVFNLYNNIPISQCYQIGTNFMIKEIIPLGTGFIFNRSEFSDCSGTIRSVAITCTITNTIAREVTDNEAILAQSIQQEKSTDSRTTKEVITPFSITPANTGDQLNPPFDTCLSETVKVSNNNNEDVVRYPSAATHFIMGKVNFEKLDKAIDALSKQIVILLGSDISPSDGVRLTPSGSLLGGYIIVEDNNKIAQRTIEFEIDTIRTECKYVTLAKPTEDDIAPIGQIGQETTPVDEEDLLLGGQVVSDQIAINLQKPSSILNPIFSKCSTDQGRSPDNLALYTIRGKIDDFNSVNIKGNTLRIAVNVDLLPIDTDQMRIVDNNNQYVKVNLAAGNKENQVVPLGFTLHDLITDCKNIRSMEDHVFSPQPLEFTP